VANELAELIKSRGHFEVSIHPSEYDAVRFSLTELLEIVRTRAVAVRGWDFPHVDDSKSQTFFADCLRQDYAWDVHIESWAMFRSGHFVSLRAYNDDWLDRAGFISQTRLQNWKPGLSIDVIGTFYRFVEIFEFAQRITWFLDPAQMVQVDICDTGLKGRRLVTDSFSYLDRIGGGVASSETFNNVREYSRAELVADPISLAVSAARELFAMFGGVDVSADVLRESLGALRLHRR
jgi:hypothetical protein